jgi:hypothetical protein
MLRRQCDSCGSERLPACEHCHPTDGEIFALHRPLLRWAYAQAQRAAGAKLMKILDDKTDNAEVFQDFDKWLRETRSRIGRMLRPSDIGPALGWLLISVSKDLTSEQGNRRGLRLPPNLIRFINVGPENSNVDLLAARRRARL